MKSRSSFIICVPPLLLTGNGLQFRSARTRLCSVSFARCVLMKYSMQPDFAGGRFDTVEFARTHRHIPPDTGPVPPSLHWALLLLLSIATLGVFAWIWVFVQARFIKRIHPVGYGLFWLTAWTFSCLLLMAVRYQGQMELIIPCRLLASGSYIAALFSMKSSMESYYNRVDKVGLQLSGVMVYFFSIFYFQYHFHRIALWRRTGVLA